MPQKVTFTPPDGASSPPEMISGGTNEAFGLPNETSGSTKIALGGPNETSDGLDVPFRAQKMNSGNSNLARSRLLAILACTVSVLVSLFAIPRALGQCEPQWLPGHGLSGVNGTVYTFALWDSDGAGPKPPKLVIGGLFTIAGNAFASNIATYDPESGSWSALGTGTVGAVRALTTRPNGDLIAGGEFTFAGGIAADRIARWNESAGTGAWSVLGTGMNSNVFALATLPNGDVVAGGAFTTAGARTRTGSPDGTERHGPR